MNQAELSNYTTDFGHLSRTTTLMREPGLRVFLLHLRAEEEMPEHEVKGSITVQCLQGRVLFSTADDSTELISGSIISLPGGVPHRLFARTASLMMVTVADS